MFTWLNLFDTKDQLRLKKLCEAGGWRVLWQDLVPFNDGRHETMKYFITLHRGGEISEVPEGAPDSATI